MMPCTECDCVDTLGNIRHNKGLCEDCNRGFLITDETIYFLFCDRCRGVVPHGRKMSGYLCRECNRFITV